MAAVALEEITKVYATGVRAVADLRLHVADGELAVLVGPSGSGKTTLLRLIAGLEEPTAGIVRIDGQVMNGVPPARRGTALVFQRPALYPHLTVRQNLGFGLRLTGACPESEIQQRAGELAGMLGLANVLDRRPAELSGGQQQRVALGRALVRRPRVVLLDEPLSSLDGPLRSELRRELHLLQRRFATTMVYVTHDQVEALALADRLFVLQEGALQQTGRPEEVYRRPANRFVAGFLGWPPMNLLEGQLAPADGGISFVGAGAVLAFPAAVGTADSGRELVLGIRPEDVRLLGSAEGGQDQARVQMTVALTEPCGFGRLVTCRRGSWQLAALAPAGPGGPRPGDEVELSFAVGRVQWFDAQDGHNLETGRPS